MTWLGARKRKRKKGCGVECRLGGRKRERGRESERKIERDKK